MMSANTYTFSDNELKQLALFFRNVDVLPDALIPLNAFAEDYVYQSMTIEEAEDFFADK